MLTKLAIWYLRKRKVSVLIGFLTYEALIQQERESAYLYDSNLMNTSYFDYEGNKIEIPEGKFEFRRTNQ